MAVAQGSRRLRCGRNAAGLLISCLLIVVASGCSTQPFSGRITVTPSPDFRQKSGLLPSVQIDVIGSSAIELQRWRAYPVSQYWTVGDTFRQNASKTTFLMTTEDPGPFTLSSWASINKRWRSSGVTYLVLIADLPGAWRPRPPKAEGQPPEGVNWYEPGSDPRRLIIPWTQSAYGFFTNEIEIALQTIGLRLKTAVNMSKAVPAAGG